MKTKLVIVFFLFAFIFNAPLSFAQNAEQTEKKPQPSLFDKASSFVNDTLQNFNKPRTAPVAEQPVKNQPVQPQEQTNEQPTQVFQPEPKIKDQDFRFIPSIGLGAISPRSTDGNSGLSRGFEPSTNAMIGFLGDYRYVPGPFAFEFGLTFFSSSSEVKNHPNGTLSLLYLGLPLNLRYYIFPIAQESRFFIKAGVQPSILLSANVTTCDSVGCGIDDDLDDYLQVSRSVKSDFNSYDILANVGVGADFLLFRDVLIDSMWLLFEVQYQTGLLNIGKSKTGLGDDIKNSGVMVNLGVAIDF